MARTHVMERLTITIQDVYEAGGCSVPGMTDRREMDRVFDCTVPGAPGLSGLRQLFFIGLSC